MLIVRLIRSHHGRGGADFSRYKKACYVVARAHAVEVTIHCENAEVASALYTDEATENLA